MRRNLWSQYSGWLYLLVFLLLMTTAISTASLYYTMQRDPVAMCGGNALPQYQFVHAGVRA